MEQINKLINEIYNIFKGDQWIDFTLESYKENRLIFLAGIDVSYKNNYDIKIIFKNVIFLSTFFDFSVSPPDTPRFIRVHKQKKAIFEEKNISDYYIFEIIDDNSDGCYIVAKNIDYEINKNGGRLV